MPIHGLDSTAGEPPIEEGPHESSSHMNALQPQPGKPATPQGADSGEVSNFLDEQLPGSPASEYSQDSWASSDSGPLPNPYDHPDYLPNPHPFPGSSQGFVEGKNPLAIPASDGLGISHSDIAKVQANSAIMRRTASAAQLNRKKNNEPIENKPTTSRFTAANHPALSPEDRSAIRSETARGQQLMRRLGPGSVVRSQKQQKEAAANPEEKEQFGMSDAEYKRRFAQD